MVLVKNIGTSDEKKERENMKKREKLQMKQIKIDYFNIFIL